LASEIANPVPVVGAALLSSGRCLAAQRGPASSSAGQWEFPGGKVEPGERPEAALVRELDEELGIQVEVGDHLGRSEFVVRERRFTLDVYVVRLRSGVPTAREHAELRWLTADELGGVRWAIADVPHLPAVRAALLAESSAR
jgi:8-oxo-dGTP diphosphatase